MQQYARENDWKDTNLYCKQMKIGKRKGDEKQ